LRFVCVTTGKPVEYEVPGDARTLSDFWSRTLLRSCRHCGQVHRFAFRAAYIEGILAKPELKIEVTPSPAPSQSFRRQSSLRQSSQRKPSRDNPSSR
jgi:hypothetical protein